VRVESSVTSLSWIPQGAVEGFNRLSFGLGVAHYDPPPPEVLGDLDELEATDRFRFANRDHPAGRAATQQDHRQSLAQKVEREGGAVAGGYAVLHHCSPAGR
jgi:hypothetical protein